VRWAGRRSWCSTVAGRGIGAAKELGAAGPEHGAAAAECTAAAADIEERCDIQKVGSGPDWLHVGVTTTTTTIVNIGVVTRIAVEHAWVGHVAGIGGRPFRKKVVGVGIAVALPARTGVTVGISGYVGFVGAVDCVGAAVCSGSRLPLAATPGSTGCTIAHGDFSVDTS